MSETTYCGFVAIIGRPNVGKSTLLNALLGQKVSITTPKAQTTRHRITGVLTEGVRQIVFVDTPGLHEKQHRALNRYMNKTVRNVIHDVDMVVFVVDAQRWTQEDDLVLKALSKIKIPVILVINKIDKISSKEALLPLIQALSNKREFAAVIPLSASKGENLDSLKQALNSHLAESMHFYPEDQVTDRGEWFIAAELVREKLMLFLGEELPYSITVDIQQFQREEKILNISALILVERDGQKAIVIGKGGQQLKKIGESARKAMEKQFGMKVFLQLWVKVKQGWADDANMLRGLGYD